MKRIPKFEIIFIVLSILMIFALFLRTSIAVIVEDLLTDLAIIPTTLGIMSSAYFWTYGLFQIPVGIFADRVGIRITVISFGLLGVAGTFLFALSPNVQMATFSRILMGAGTAGIWIPTLKYLSLTYAPAVFATRSSIITSIGSVGIVFSTLPMALLVEAVGWRFSYGIVAALFLLFIVISWYLLDVPKAEDKNKGKQVIYFSFWKTTAFWYFTAWAFFTYGIVFSFQSLWGVAYLQNAFGLTREMAGTHLMFASIGLILGAPIWGVMSDRFFRARRPVLFLSTFGLLVIWLSLSFISDYPGFSLVSLIYFGIGFFCATFIINFSCVKEFFPLNIAGTVLGTLNTFMFLGVGFFQGMTGFVIDYFVDSGVNAFRSVFSIYSVCIFLALILVYFMPETFLQEK